MKGHDGVELNERADELAVAARDLAAGMQRMSTEVAVEADGLVKTYGKDVRALDGLGFARAEAGTVFGLLGRTAPASRRPSRS